LNKSKPICQGQSLIKQEEEVDFSTSLFDSDDSSARKRNQTLPTAIIKIGVNGDKKFLLQNEMHLQKAEGYPLVLVSIR